MTGPEALLRAIAKIAKKRVQRCQFYDRNVCDFEWGDLEVRVDPHSKRLRVSDPVIRSGGPFTSKAGLLRAGHPVSLWANSENMLISVRGELRQQMRCSINAPDADDFRQAKLSAEGLGFPVYLRSEAKPAREILSFLSSRDVRRSVRALIKRDTDSLHFRVNEVALYVHPQSQLEIENAIKILLGFVGSFRPQREQWDLAALPPEFQHLIPLIKEWAECDDNLRSDLISEASEPSLRKLIQGVAPLFGSINRYLDTFDDVLPEAAIALQALAECAAEAQVATKGLGIGKRMDS